MKKLIFLKAIVLLISLSFIIGALSLPASAERDPFPDVSKADAVFLYNVNTDKLIWSKNLDKSIFTGSITKMMCGITFCELFSDRLDQSITITEEMISGAEGAKIKLASGDTLTYKDLLYGVICGGGNDACYALAYACSGSVEAYVKLMNDLALSFGLSDTLFTNPSGYDDEKMYTTAYDTLSLARRAINNEL